MRIKKLVKAKDDAIRAKVAALGLDVRSTRTVERLAKDGSDIVAEDLATIELQDGSSITVDLNDPDHGTAIERARDRIEQQIRDGKRLRKPKAI